MGPRLEVRARPTLNQKKKGETAREWAFRDPEKARRVRLSRSSSHMPEFMSPEETAGEFGGEKAETRFLLLVLQPLLPTLTFSLSLFFFSIFLPPPKK